MTIEIGDTVKVIGIPVGLSNDPVMKTKEVFEKTLGNWYIVQDTDYRDGLGAMVELAIVEDASAHDADYIWIEEALVEKVPL